MYSSPSSSGPQGAPPAPTTWQTTSPTGLTMGKGVGGNSGTRLWVLKTDLSVGPYSLNSAAARSCEKCSAASSGDIASPPRMVERNNASRPGSLMRSNAWYFVGLVLLVVLLWRLFLSSLVSGSRIWSPSSKASEPPLHSDHSTAPWK